MTSAGTRRGRTFSTAPWRRAPLLLLGQPVVVLAIVFASAVLGAAAASGPLFLSEIGTAAVQVQTSQHCPELAMPSASVQTQPMATQYTPRVNDGLSTELNRSYAAQGLPRPENVLLGSNIISTTRVPPALMPQRVNTFWRPDALDHLDKVSSVGGQGLWLTTYTAAQFKIRPGMNVYLGGKPVRVVGIYDRLDNPLNPSHQLPRYWCTWHDQIAQGITANSSPTFAIATNPSIVVRNSYDLSSTWYSRINVGRMTLDQDSSAVVRGQAAARTVQVHSKNQAYTVVISTTLGEITGRAHRIRDGISGAVVPIAVGGVVVALVLVAGAGVFWTIRRRREVRLLLARGIGPTQLGVKAVLETAPWVVTGSVAGYVLGLALDRTLGPTSLVESNAVGTSLVADAVAVVVAVLSIGSVATAFSRTSRTRGLAALRRWRGVPWELGLIGAAAVVYYTTHGTGVVVDQGIVQLRPAVLAFPLLGLTGGVLLLTRLLRLVAPAMQRSAERRRLSTFLSWSRIAATPAAAVGLVIGVALPCALLVYAGGTQDSLRHSIQTKYQTNIGAPHVVRLAASPDQKIELHGTGTHVSLIVEEPRANGDPVEVMGVDPKTFADFAYVDDTERGLVQRLTRPTRGSPVSAVVVNNNTGSPIRTVGILHDRVPLHVLDNLPVFPGLSNPTQPLIVVNEAALATTPVHVERSERIWTDDAHHAAALHLMQQQHIPVFFELTPDGLVDYTGLLPVSWILDYLRALAVLIGLVAVSGVVFSLGARASRQAVAYVMAVRMGVSRRAHLVSLVRELTLLIGAGWLVGVTLAEGGVAAVVRLLDTLPSFPPPPTFVFDLVLALVLAGVGVGVAAVGAVFAHTIAHRAKPSEVLRAS